MGDPKFSRRLYDTPSHPWQLERIQAENDVIKAYGLKNKTEVWKAQSLLRRFRRQARNLLAQQFTGDPQVELEIRQLLGRLHRLGVLGEDAKLEDVLALNLESVLARRFQTIVYHRGLAGSHKQARQLITHNHIHLNGGVVNVPGYLVGRAEEESIAYAPHSPLTNEAHPMRPKPRAPGEQPAERGERGGERGFDRGDRRGGDRRGGPPRGDRPPRPPAGTPPATPAPAEPATPAEPTTPAEPAKPADSGGESGNGGEKKKDSGDAQEA